MPTPRITLRCFTEDLGRSLPSVDDELDTAHPIVEELKSRSRTAPQGLKRILSIPSPLVYRLQRGRHRGAAWVDDTHGLFWLLACEPREEGSRDDAYERFIKLYAARRLLPTTDDWARVRLEAATRQLRVLREDIARLLSDARERQGACVAEEIAEEIPVRLVCFKGEGIDEIWVAVGTVDARGRGVEKRVRDMVFALIQAAAGPGEWEYTREWPGGVLRWHEVARYGLTPRES